MLSQFLTIFVHVSFRERAEIFTFVRLKHTIIFNSLLVKLIFVETTCPCVRNIHDMAFLMTNFTDQKTRNFKNSINDCERAERASLFFCLPFCLKHTFIFNSLLVNHISVDTTVLVHWKHKLVVHLRDQL